MNAGCAKICSLLLALAMMPGVFEVVENAAHLLGEGHLAHVSDHDEQHGPVDQEHGCTPIFHLCGCHVSLAFLKVPALHMNAPRADRFSLPIDFAPTVRGFHRSIERPPRA